MVGLVACRVPAAVEDLLVEHPGVGGVGERQGHDRQVHAPHPERRDAHDHRRERAHGDGQQQRREELEVQMDVGAGHGHGAEAGERELGEGELSGPPGEDRHRDDDDRDQRHPRVEEVLGVAVDHERNDDRGCESQEGGNPGQAPHQRVRAQPIGQRRHPVRQRPRAAIASGRVAAGEEHPAEHHDEQQDLHEAGLVGPVVEHDPLDDPEDDAGHDGDDERPHASQERDGESDDQQLEARALGEVAHRGAS